MIWNHHKDCEGVHERILFFFAEPLWDLAQKDKC
jgi:hypothetical protein